VNQEIKTIPLGIVNCYLIKADAGFFLVDTGFSGQRAALESALLEAGCLPGNLKLILLTHGDADHGGNAAYIRDRFQARIAMHKNDESLALSSKAQTDDLRERETRRFVSWLILRIGVILAGLKRDETYIGFKPDLSLSDRQSLREYGLNATVLHIPGHTSGSIGILTEENDLFAGDIVRNFGKPSVNSMGQNLADLDASVGRLKGLNLRNVYPGHGKAFAMGELT
jgi:hydroxyacylglutathione hydrolase